MTFCRSDLASWNFLFAIYLSDIFAVLVLIAYQTLETLWYHIDRQLEACQKLAMCPLPLSFFEFENVVKRGPSCLIFFLKSRHTRYSRMSAFLLWFVLGELFLTGLSKSVTIAVLDVSFYVPMNNRISSCSNNPSSLTRKRAMRLLSLRVQITSFLTTGKV